MFKFDKRDAEASALRTPLERLPTGIGEANHLAYEEQVRSRNTDAIEYGLGQEYKKTLDEIEKRTGQRLVNPANYFGFNDSGKDSSKAMHDFQVARINEFIARNQNEFPDLKPIDPDATLQTVISKAKQSRQDWALASEYAGTGATISGFLGGMGGSALDPPNVAANIGSLFVPGSRALLPLIIREGLINAGTEALLEPGKRDVAATLGEKRTGKDMAMDVGMAGLFGVGFAGTVHGVAQGFSYLRGLRSSPDPQARAAGIAGERAVEAIHEDNPSAYTAKTASAESGGSLTAKSPSSSATGKFQFLEGTWNDLAAETGVPRIVEGQPDPRLNEEYQNKQMGAYTKRSTEALQAAGFDANDTNLYVAHFLGQDGAVNFLKGLQANPDAPATSFVSPEAVAANRSVFFKGDKPKTAQEFYQWANKKMGQKPSGLPEQHIQNYDNAMTAMAADEAAPDPGVIPGKARPPHVDGLEQIDPKSLQVDARTFQFKEGGNELGVTDRLAGVDQWEPDFAGIALVYEKKDGSRFIADGHQRLALAKRTGAETMTARVLREADGWTPDEVRARAAIKNITEGTGSPLDAAKVMRAAKGADLPPMPPTSALVRQGRALAELSDEAFQMVVNRVIPENYGAIVGKVLKDPKLQEAAIKVLNKTSPENSVQAEAIVRQIGQTDLTTTKQSTLFGDEAVSESLYLERAKVLDAGLKSLKKDKAVFSTLVDKADQIEGAGNILSRDANLERMTQDAKVSEYIQQLANRKGPISDALTAAAKSLKEGARPSDTTRSFLSAVRGAIEESTPRRSVGRNGGSMADSQRPLEPAEIKASQDYFESQKEEYFNEIFDKEVDEALKDGRLSEDTTMLVPDPASGNMVKRKVKDLLDEIKADKTLVAEVKDCVEGGPQE